MVFKTPEFCWSKLYGDLKHLFSHSNREQLETNSLTLVFFCFEIWNFGICFALSSTNLVVNVWLITFIYKSLFDKKFFNTPFSSYSQNCVFFQWQNATLMVLSKKCTLLILPHQKDNILATVSYFSFIWIRFDDIIYDNF